MLQSITIFSTNEQKFKESGKMQPIICGFSKVQQAKLAEDIAHGRELFLALLGHHQGPPTAAQLDRVFQAWAAQPVGQRMADDNLANGLGSLFGELLKSDFGFVWQIIEDKFGAEPALVDEGTGSVVFPINAVWKRIEPEVDPKAFFQPMYDSIAQHLGKMQTGHSGL